MKKVKKKNYIIAIALLLLVGIGIGYAAITTTLNIKGNSTIQTNNWNIKFTNVVVTTGSVSTTQPVISDDEITYSAPLSTPGDFYEFTVDVTNSGSIDAILSSTPTLAGITTEQDVYTNYTVVYSDGNAIKQNDVLEAGKTVSVKVRVEYDADIENDQLPTANQSMNLTFSMDYVQDK